MKIEKIKLFLCTMFLGIRQGQIIDQSETDEAAELYSGIGNIIPGLERALEGKSIGDKFNITITPDDGGLWCHPTRADWQSTEVQL